MDARYIPFPAKINLHRKTRELIYNDMRKKSLAKSKEEDLLGKVIN